MSIFFDVISNLGSATINIPIAQLLDPSCSAFITLGISMPAVATPRLASIGLFDYAVAENISKSLFESAGKTLTGHWMDATGPYQNLYPKGVSVGWHRMHGHHFLSDAIHVSKDPNLSLIDFYKHLATDIVTKNGIPILPESIVRSLAELLGVTPTKIMPWVSMNLLDVGTSIFSVSHAGSNLISLVNGSAEWSFGYALNTFGVGSLEVAVGAQTTNPILIGSGVVDIACGTVKAYQYYTQPFLCGVPVAEILNASAVGAGFGAILATVEMALSDRNTSTSEKVKKFLGRVSTSSLLSTLSVISVPLSITTSFGLVGFSLAKQMSTHTNQYVRAVPNGAYLSHQIDQFIATNYIDSDVMNRMFDHLEQDENSMSSEEIAMLRYLQ